MSDQVFTPMPKVCERWLESAREVCCGKIRMETRHLFTAGLYRCDRCGACYGPGAPEGVSGPEQGAAGGARDDAAIWIRELDSAAFNGSTMALSPADSRRLAGVLAALRSAPPTTEG